MVYKIRLIIRSYYGYNAAAAAYPAREVGGDFYDCFESDEGVCMVMGDVSGKGIGAALFMAMAKTMIREKLRAGMSPAAALNTANNELCAENPEGMFATVFAAVLDTDTGELRYANAGHTRPVVIKSGNAELIKPDAGIALGLFEDSGIIDKVMMLDKGDGIFLYTDGVTEAVGSGNAFYGEGRLIASARGDNAVEVMYAVSDSVMAFTDGCEQFDDVTALAVFYSGEAVRMTLEPTLDSIDEVKGVIFRAAADSKKKLKIILACEEIMINIVSYAKAERIDFACSTSGERLVIRICDNGVEFDPVGAESIEKSFEEYDTGGMGISLVKQIAHKLVYRRIDNENILKMIFTL